MIFKIIGGLFVIFSTTLFSIYVESNDKYRIEDLEDIKNGFSLFISNMEYTHLPLSEVFFNISKKINGVSKDIFKKTSDLLYEHKFETAYEAWEFSILENYEKSYFNENDIEEFLYFGKNIGYLDFSRQIENGRQAIYYIERSLEDLRKKRDKGRKLYRSLGMLFGLLIVIVLL